MYRTLRRYVAAIVTVDIGDASVRGTLSRVDKHAITLINCSQLIPPTVQNPTPAPVEILGSIIVPLPCVVQVC